MTRTPLTTVFIACMALMGPALPCALGQANAPLDVSPASGQPAADSRDRDLRQFAQQMVQRTSQPSASTPPASEPAQVSPAPAAALTPAVSPAGSAGGVASPAPPVVAPDPNESKPLGTKSTPRTPGSSDASSSEGSGWGMFQTIIALAFVVGLILVGKQVVLRLMGRPAAVSRSKVVEVLSRVSVGPRQHVMLIRLGGRIIVVGDSAGQMRLLANLDEPEEVAGILKAVTSSKPTSVSESFNQLMGKFDQDFDRAEADRLRDEGKDVTEHQADRARDQLSGLLARVRSMSGKGGV